MSEFGGKANGRQGAGDGSSSCGRKLVAGSRTPICGYLKTTFGWNSVPAILVTMASS